MYPVNSNLMLFHYKHFHFFTLLIQLLSSILCDVICNLKVLRLKNFSSRLSFKAKSVSFMQRAK